MDTNMIYASEFTHCVRARISPRKDDFKQHHMRLEGSSALLEIEAPVDRIESVSAHGRTQVRKTRPACMLGQRAQIFCCGHVWRLSTRCLRALHTGGQLMLLTRGVSRRGRCGRRLLEQLVADIDRTIKRSTFPCNMSCYQHDYDVHWAYEWLLSIFAHRL
jgi:hypothetical protein